MKPFLALCFYCLVLLAVAKSIRENKKQPGIQLKMPSWHRLREFSKRLPRSEGDGAPGITPTSGPQLVMGIGTPEQDLTCIIDTTSGDTWIVDINAMQPYPGKPWYFRPGNSTTLSTSNYAYVNDVVDINGLHAQITGTIARDAFSALVIKDHGFDNPIFQQRFALIETVKTSYARVPDELTAGSCGFGFSASDNMDLFLPALLTSSNLTSVTTIFVLCTTATTSEGMAELAGFVDPAYCNVSTTVTVPLSDRSNWNFAINGYAIGDLSSTKRQMATMNTRELRTGVPANVYSYVYKLTNATMDHKYNWPVVDCNQQFPDLHINVGGDDVSVTPELYIYEDFRQLHQPCHLMLYPLNGGGFLPSWSFGYIWMYKKCITFDYYNRQMSFTDYNTGLCDK